MSGENALAAMIQEWSFPASYTKDEVLDDHGLTSSISLWVCSLREVNSFPAMWQEKPKSRSDLMGQSAIVLDTFSFSSD